MINRTKEQVVFYFNRLPVHKQKSILLYMEYLFLRPDWLKRFDGLAADIFRAWLMIIYI